MRKYESEDDASFTEMLVQSSEAHRKKHAWLYDKEKALTFENKMALTNESESSNLKAGLQSWGYTAKNSLMYIPDGVEYSAEAVIKAVGAPSIAHANTRLPGDFVQKYQQSSDCSKQPVQDKVGVDGKVLVPDESPRIKGYGFMATPQINPGNWGFTNCGECICSRVHTFWYLNICMILFK